MILDIIPHRDSSYIKVKARFLVINHEIWLSRYRKIFWEKNQSSWSIICPSVSPIRSMQPVTRALPMQKYWKRSLMPVSVQCSGKPWILLASFGVRRRRRPVSRSCTTWVLRFVVPSLVSIVRAGRSTGSGKAIGPSEKVYLCPVFDVRSIFFAPFRYFHLSRSSPR